MSQTVKYPIPQGATDFSLVIADPVFTIPQPPPDNQAPIVNAGSDLAITLPTSVVNLRATATDTDGTLQSTLWSQTSGNKANIVSPTSLTTEVNGLTEGVYVFGFTATDNSGAQSFDSITITVKAAVTPPPTDGYELILDFSTKYFDTLNALMKEHNQHGAGTLTQIPGTDQLQFNSIVASGNLISSGRRSEIQADDTPQNGAWEWDVVYNDIPAITGLSGQWHANSPDGTSADAAIWLASRQFQIMRNVSKIAGQGNIYQTGSLQTLKTGVKYHWRIEANFATDNTGFFRAYLNNQLYYKAENTQTDNGSSAFFKIGLYMFSSFTGNCSATFTGLKIYRKL